MIYIHYLRVGLDYIHISMQYPRVGSDDIYPLSRSRFGLYIHIYISMQYPRLGWDNIYPISRMIYIQYLGVGLNEIYIQYPGVGLDDVYTVSRSKFG